MVRWYRHKKSLDFLRKGNMILVSFIFFSSQKMTTTKRWLTPLAVFLSFFVGFGVWACSCAWPDVATQIENTPNIYIAKVRSITPYTWKVDSELWWYSKYTLDIQTIFKWENKEGYIVTPSSGASCGLEGINEGDEVLFYTYLYNKKSPHFAGLCGATKKISDATEDLKLLNAKYPHPLHICPADQTFRDGKCQKITSRWGRLRGRLTSLF